MGRSRHGIIGPDDPSISYRDNLFAYVERAISEYLDSFEPWKRANRYAYVCNNPVNNIDPLGLQTIPIYDPRAMLNQAEEVLKNAIDSSSASEPVKEVIKGAVDRAIAVPKEISNLATNVEAAAQGDENAKDALKATAAIIILDALTSDGEPTQDRGGTTSSPPNPHGRKGNPDHQADVQAVQDANPNMREQPVGNRVPDNVGLPGEPATIRGVTIEPFEGAPVIHESERTVYGGTMPVSAGRAQIRDIRSAAPGSPIVVTDPANPDSPPIVYPPGTQPPPRGRVDPSNPIVEVPQRQEQ